MVFLRLPLIAMTFFFFVSCAKMQYLLEQGQGQVALLNKAKPNEVFLKDVRIPPLFKEKVKKIEEYKQYFFNYFNLKAGSIYSKTMILDRDAVTYLLIASPFDNIKAKEECFPLMGCFPYLGYFSKNSAEQARLALDKEGWDTWIRPVYAYSTLGYFSDPILSSFFVYKDYDLAEMIFHELFHTIFWVKNEVELNENLAVYFSENLALEYFKFDEQKKAQVLRSKKSNDELMIFLVNQISQLNKAYAEFRAQNKEKPFFQNYLHNKLVNNIMPEVKKKCEHLDYKEDSCWPLKREWNNASFAALLTYQARGESIANLHKGLNISLKEYFYYLKKRYDDFPNKNVETFEKDLFR